LSFQGLTVIDYHAHFPFGWRGGSQKEILRDYNRRRQERFRKEWDFPEPELAGAAKEELANKWANEMEKHGLKHVVFMTGGGNDSLAEIVGLHPDKFFGFAHHDPASPDALAELKRGVEKLKLKGYKILAPRMALSFDDPELMPVWEYCAEHTIPLLIHFGLLGTGGGIVSHPMISPLAIFNVAHTFPEIPIIVPHFGCGYWQELLHLCWSCPNVYVDTSGSNQWMRWMPYELTLESLFRKAYETVGSERIIFGTDSSWFPRGFSIRYLQDQYRVCQWIGMKEDDLQNIFANNAAKLLGVTVE
jgi:uncharacterized protein